MDKRNIIAISLLSIFPIAQAAQPDYPTFTSEALPPDISTVVTNPAYRSVYDEIETKWQTYNNAGSISDKAYVNDVELKKKDRVPEGTTQSVTLKKDSHIFNTTINSVQVNVSDGYESNDIGSAINIYIKGKSEQEKGFLVMNANTIAYQTTIDKYGVLSLRKGSSYDTKILAGGRQSVSGTSYAQNTIIDGGEQEISIGSNGLTKDTLIINGGQQFVYGGRTENTHLGEKSYQLVNGSAFANNTFIYNGGFQLVHSDNVGAGNTTVDARRDNSPHKIKIT